MSECTYIRISRSQRRVARIHGLSVSGWALVDPVVDAPATASSIDQMLVGAGSQILGSDVVVVRTPLVFAAGLGFEESAVHLLNTLRDGRFGTVFGGAIGVLAFRPGRAPLLTGDASMDEGHALAVLRQLELSALLEWGSAIWRLGGAHFRLPNGRHSRTFVRVEHAFQSNRDVEVIADWLACGLREKSGLLLDSSSILALGQRLDVLAREAGFGPLRIATLPHYPSGYDEVSQGVEDVLVPSAQTGLLGVVTASASGRLTGYMGRKFADLGVPRSQIHLLVERTQIGRPRLSGVADGDELPNVWTVLDPEEASGDDCLACRTTTDAPVVLIDPRTYDPFPFPVPTLQAPDEVPMYVNRPLLRLSARTQAIDVGIASDEADAPRDRQRMGVKFSYDRLFSAPPDEVASAVSESVRHLRLLAERDSEIADALEAVSSCDVALVREAEIAGPDDGVRQGFREALDALGLTHVDLVPVRRHGMGSNYVEPADLAALSGRRVLIVHVGMVTGWNSRRMLDFLYGLNDVDTDGVSALILHARPESHDIWRSIRALYGGRCLSLWHTPLPWASPLEEEGRLLERFAGSLQGGLDGPQEAFLRNRLEVTSVGWSAAMGESNPLYWGGQPGLTTTSSPFGSEVDAAGAFAAAGSAVGLARYRGLHAAHPAWVVFDMRRLAVERYDPLSLAGVQRWIRPGEAWWGDSPGEIRRTAELICDLLASSENRTLGLAELMLASAQGKVPFEAQVVFEHEATSSQTTSPAIQLATSLLSWVRTEEQQGVGPSSS